MKILVIVMKRIGDAIVTLPVCSSARGTWPDACIDFMVYEEIAPLFEGHPDIDRVVALTRAERARLSRFLAKVAAIRKTRYDVVVDLKTLGSSALITLCSGARRTAGFSNPRTRGWVYRRRVPRHLPGETTVAQRLRVLEALGEPIRRETRIVITPRDDEIRVMRQRMIAAGVDFNRPALLFHITSSRPRKTWPLESFVDLMRHCARRYDAQSILSAGPGEREYVRAAAVRVSDAGAVFPDIETGSLRELAALCGQCDMYIGNDSGPRHVAEAVGTPTFAIFAPGGAKSVWMPVIDENHDGIDFSDLGMDNTPSTKDSGAYYARITPAMAADRLDRMLSRILPASRPALSGV